MTKHDERYGPDLVTREGIDDVGVAGAGEPAHCLGDWEELDQVDLLGPRPRRGIVVGPGGPVVDPLRGTVDLVMLGGKWPVQHHTLAGLLLDLTYCAGKQVLARI
jgi:hypothetical protein